MHKEPGYYQPQSRGNQISFPAQIRQQIPQNLTSQQNTLLQGPIQAQDQPSYVNTVDATHAIRPMVGRVQQYAYQSPYAQHGHRNDVVSGPRYQAHPYQVSPQHQYVQNSMPYAQGYSNINYAARNPQYAPVYVVGPQMQGNFTSSVGNVVIAPQMNTVTRQSHPLQGQPPRQQQQHMFAMQNTMSNVQQQQQQQHQHQQNSMLQ